MHLTKVTKSPYFEYGDTGIQVQIRYVPDSETSETLSQTTMTVFDKRHQKTEKVDNDKFNTKMMTLAVVGWKPFLRRQLKFLISPDQGLSLEEGETWEDLIEPTKENIDLVLNNTHIDFKTFVISASRDAETFIKVNEKQELANLKNTSGGM